MTKTVIEKMTDDNNYNLDRNIISMKKKLAQLKEELKRLDIVKINMESKFIENKSQYDRTSGRIQELEFCCGFLDNASKEWGVRTTIVEADTLYKTPVKKDHGAAIEDRIAKNLCTRFNRTTKKYCNRKLTTKKQKEHKLCKVCLKEFT